MNNLKGIMVSILCIFALSACTNKHKNKVNPADISDANAAYANSQSATNGLGQESGFGDDGVSSGQILTKRTYYFDFDSNVVHEEDRPAIEANANYLLAHPNIKVTIQGHTDPRGSREYNIGLGERRAKAVADIMSSLGVNHNQIRVVSYGAEKLASFGRTEADYQKDRRAVLVYTH